MAIPVKQSIPINFAQGLDLKTDPFQVPIGKFLALQNSIFTKGGLLQKRNGFGYLSTLPDDTYTYLTTFNGNLTAIGSNLAAYNEANASYIVKGQIQPVTVNTLPLVRNNFNQTQSDSVIASNGVVCTVYTESTGGGVDYKYVIADSVTGQNIVAPTLIPSSVGTVAGSPRVFLLGNYFCVVYTVLSGGNYQLQYIAISINQPTIVTTPTQYVSSYEQTSNLSWDGIVSNNSLYIGYSTTTGGQSVKITVLTSQRASQGLAPNGTTSFAGQTATSMSMCADATGVIWAAYYNSGTSNGYALAINSILGTLLAPTQIITAMSVDNITCVAQNSICYVYYEVVNAYSYDSSIPTDYIDAVNVTLTGTVSSTTTIVRGVGLASKAFIIAGTIYFLSAYQSSYQPSYYLINATESLSSSPVIVSSLAYENGGGYVLTGLPSAIVDGTTVSIAYLFKDLIAAVNKNTNVPSGTQVNGIYSQTGINLVSFDLTTTGLDTAEIGNNLNLSGGFLWGYDGVQPVENNFFVYPDNIEATVSPTGGSMSVQQYYYQVTYEWTDNQGNAFRSAPSIPITVTTVSATSSVTINVPYLRLTYKVKSPVKIVVYRWSAAQEIYYQVTSISQPVLNNTTADSVAIVDTSSDATILGNNILYTTGGVVENVSGPASNLLTLFDDRLWLVDAEDQNLLWYSKQVIEATPVEMSDLFTFYVAPSTAAQGSTGVITAISPLDDKLIIFKANALYYINGTGPDNTGSNSQYSQPIFVTSTVGCSNQKSIVFMPQGLMFQSDKGIWLLGRDMSTQYIGAPVESLTIGATVLSAVNVPGTNQVRFTMNNGYTLMYDYYYGQWGTFVKIPGLSSTLYKNLHTYISAFGQVFQETPGIYLDGSEPTLLSFQTGWINPAGLQGYIRSYWFYLLGVYKTPHKLELQIAYDYSPTPEQSVLITPNNYNPTYGNSGVYGQQSPYGGPPALENWRVFMAKQRCQAFQIYLNEVYDPTFDVPAGQGLTLSGINLVLGVKKAWRNISSATSAGAS